MQVPDRHDLLSILQFMDLVQGLSYFLIRDRRFQWTIKGRTMRQCPLFALSQATASAERLRKGGGRIF
jgi:hypothetical protein